MSGSFDRFMVHVDIGTDEKLARLTDSERLCHITGVLALAAKSPIRGRLLVGKYEAGPIEIARRSGLSERVARATLEKLSDVGVLIRDDEHGCWRVHNWEKFNPPPKNDPTNAERQARHRARNGRSNTASNGAVTPPFPRARVIARARTPEGKEVEGEDPTLTLPREGNNNGTHPSEEAPLKPPGNRKRDRVAFDAQMTAWANHYFPDADPGAVSAAVGWLASRDTLTSPITVRHVRDLAATNSIWGTQLQPHQYAAAPLTIHPTTTKGTT